MKTMLMYSAGLLALSAGAVAHAEPVSTDSRTLTMNGMSARLERFSDTTATDPYCQTYGLLTVADANHSEMLTQKLCGADGMLGVRQGDSPVIYVQMRGRDGAGLYRYMPLLRKGDVYDFKATELKVVPEGTDVRIVATHNTNGLLNDEKWTWRYGSDAPKPVNQPRRYVID